MACTFSRPDCRKWGVVGCRTAAGQTPTGLNRADRSRHEVQFTATEDIFDSISLDGGTELRLPLRASGVDALRSVWRHGQKRPEAKEAGCVPHLQKGMEPTKKEQPAYVAPT